MTPGEAFDFTYALIRWDSNDDTVVATPVIFGAATPDDLDPDRGLGLTLWDFEANYDFENTYGSSVTAAALDRGRFVAIYGDITEPDSGASVAFAYAVTGAGYGGLSADLLYGLITSGANRLGFLDWKAVGDFCGTDAGGYIVCFDDYDPLVHTDAGNEDMKVRLAFANEGRGRGFISLWNGDIEDPAPPDPDILTGEECWNDSVTTTWVALDQVNLQGTSAACEAPFDDGGLISEAEIPSLDDLDAADRAQIRCVADNGPASELCN
jgi:hypothetical protein